MLVCLCARVQQAGGSAATVYRVRYSGGMPLYRGAFVPSGCGTATQGIPLNSGYRSRGPPTVVHKKNRLHGQRGKGKADSISREK